MIDTKQLGYEHIYYKRRISQLENEPEYRQLPNNKLNQILHQSSELSSEPLFRTINDRRDKLNALKYKLILAVYLNRSQSSNNKNKIYLIIKILDRDITRISLDNELSYLLN